MTLCYIPLLDGKQIKPEGYALVEQAKKLGDSVTAFIIHCGIDEQTIRLDCEDVHLIELPEKLWPISSIHIEAFRSFQEKRTDEAILFSSSPMANEIAAGLAFKLDRPLVNNVMDAVRENQHLSIKKEVYGGKACLYDETGLCSIITYDSAFLPPVKSETDRRAPAFHLHIKAEGNANIRFIEKKKLCWEEIGLTEAACVIGIGRGVYSLDGNNRLDMIKELAKVFNAPVGGSKVADELKLVPKERRIGSSGVSLDQADIYIAIGISGSSQHLDGIKNVKHILAINIDPAAPIFKRADLGIVSDFKEAVPQLVEIIKNKSGVNNSENISHLKASV
ncbi:MAG TPA: electron transfer flavoprotein subunit alpha/FixB family protein [Bacillus bacterium]|uniref:electron transfer flavoprotein subunit alpha/FixB family protein n=1 Tax=Siminovitchia fordii TaxID=254759 RepID=UPI00037ADD35|nr:electron transfer flavoprotein subunit alpha/FixB family protein [Siminovitchia fordii]HBZ10554.1 electron transfer flavoprotein subunit alpha/FixB family protein [Bacillus sp. (in: firmicutes)]